MADIVIMPRLSLNEETNLLSHWYVSEGDRVAKGDKLFCVETDKSTLDVDSEFDGIVLKKYYGDYEVVEVLSPVCVVGQEGEDIPELYIPEKDKADETEVKAGAEPETTKIVQQQSIEISKRGEPKGISPRAKKLAEQNGITDFTSIPTSGAENRIMEEDIIRSIKEGAVELHTVSAQRTAKLPKIRKVIAKNMVNSLQTTAQLTINSIFNASAILNLRESYKREQGEMKGVTIGDLVLYATARTLVDFPYMNSWMINDDEAVEFENVNLGCAVDTERGLMVPTIVDANSKSLLEISNNLKELAQECRAVNISPDKLKNATFTVTNLGSFGIRHFTPIINPPQVGILGVGTIDYMVKKTKEGFLYYPACSLSLTFDHRLVDGGPAARFLKKLCENLENVEELI